MADWFTFAGVKSTGLGIYVQEFPDFTFPAERATFKPVPGRSGSLTLLEGDTVYDDITLSVECFVRDLTNIDAIGAWLRGRGALILGTVPDRYYDARVINQIEFAKVLRGHEHRTLTVNFRCHPFRYIYPAATDVVMTVSGTTIQNTGNVPSEPIIDVEGTGDITLTVGGDTFIITGLTDEIIIDSPKQTCYDTVGTTNLSGIFSNVDLKWPTLPVGTSAISWTGTVTKVTVTPNWRCL
jgi:predicted phage tail component-like protein